MGERTRRLGDEVRQHLMGKGAVEEQADSIARAIADTFGKTG